MKTNLFFLAFLLFAFAACQPAADNEANTGTNEDQPAGTPMAAADNSRTSLDWDGIYTGTLPCADCEGIKTMIWLKNDETYVAKTKYLGKSDEVFTQTGNLNWNEAGSKITLQVNEEGDQIARTYQVGENVLFHLDNDGNRITGDMADKYRLTKQQKGIVGKRWKLVQLMGKDIADMDPQPQKEPFLVLEEEDNKIYGSTGCNNVMGSYELTEGNRISFAPNLASTMMACPEMEVENTFQEVLNKVDTYTLSEDGTTMNMSKSKTAPFAVFEVDYMTE